MMVHRRKKSELWGLGLFRGSVYIARNITRFCRKLKTQPSVYGAILHRKLPHCAERVNAGGADQGRFRPCQSPSPGLGEKNFSSLPGTPSNSLASGGASRLTVMFGHLGANSALRASHFSSPGSVSGLIASTGHSGSHTPQSMHSSGWMTSMLSPSYRSSRPDIPRHSPCTYI